jgi:hypothetical protein
VHFQQDGGSPRYRRDVRSCLDEILPGQWIDRRCSVKYPTRSPDLTPLDFYFWGSLKDVVYRR